MDMIPGEVSYWLRRANVGELQDARLKEMSKQFFARRMRLVIAIDEELMKRDRRGPVCCIRCDEEQQPGRPRRFVVCQTCGNKRCPHATDHRLVCSGSNEPGQSGSRYK